MISASPCATTSTAWTSKRPPATSVTTSPWQAGPTPLLRRRHRPHPPDRPGIAPSGEQPGHPGPRRRCRRRKDHGRRNVGKSGRHRDDVGMNTNGHKVSRCLDVPDIQRITSTLDVVADHRKRNPRHRRPFNIVDHLRQEGAETIWVTPRHQLPADRPMITPAIKHQQRTCRRRVHPSFRPTNIRRTTGRLTTIYGFDLRTGPSSASIARRI